MDNQGVQLIVIVFFLLITFILMQVTKRPERWFWDEFWDSLGKTDEITITLDRPDGIYQPGETVRVTVMIKPRKDMKLTGARVKLSSTKVYETHVKSYTGAQGDVFVKKEFFASDYSFLGQTMLPRGTGKRYRFRMNLPADALPSSTVGMVQVRWQISVKLNRPGLLIDLHAKKELWVLSRAPGQPTRYGTPIKSLDA